MFNDDMFNDDEEMKAKLEQLQKNIPKNLPDMITKIAPQIAEFNGCTEQAAKEGIVAGLSWFVVSMEQAKDKKDFLEKLMDDIKIIGITTMMEGMAQHMRAKRATEDAMNKFKKE